ncbi:MAG: redoxin domain-containing protein [Anaerolineales bacterium]|nr:redoxin domain-containing protein [Anaerolineales bacterium]
MAAVTLVGERAPDFALRDLGGQLHPLGDTLGRITILVFWSADCPHVARLDAYLLDVARDWTPEVISWRVASMANESQSLLLQRSQALGVSLILLDPDQVVADAYGAQVMPHVVVFDRGGVVRHCGAWDDVTFRQRLPARNYLAETVSSLLRGEVPAPRQEPAFGCALVRVWPAARSTNAG